MNTVELTRFIRDDLMQRCGRGRFGLMEHLLSSTAKFVSERVVKLRAWVQSMDDENKEYVRLLMDQCVDSCLFSLAAIADGVSGLNGRDSLRVTLVSGDTEVDVARGNAPGGTEWHHVVSDIINGSA